MKTLLAVVNICFVIDHLIQNNNPLFVYAIRVVWARHLLNGVRGRESTSCHISC